MPDETLFRDPRHLRVIFSEVALFSKLFAEKVIELKEQSFTSQTDRLTGALMMAPKVSEANMSLFKAYETNAEINGTFQVVASHYDDLDIMEAPQQPDAVGLRLAVQQLEMLLQVSAPFLDVAWAKNTYATVVQTIDAKETAGSATLPLIWTSIDAAERKSFFEGRGAKALAALIPQPPV